MTLPASGQLNSSQVLTEIERLTASPLNSSEVVMQRLVGVGAGAEFNSASLYGKYHRIPFTPVTTATGYTLAYHGGYVVFVRGSAVVWRNENTGMEGQYSYAESVKSVVVSERGYMLVSVFDLGQNLNRLYVYNGIGGAWLHTLTVSPVIGAGQTEPNLFTAGNNHVLWGTMNYVLDYSTDGGASWAYQSRLTEQNPPALGHVFISNNIGQFVWSDNTQTLIGYPYNSYHTIWPIGIQALWYYGGNYYRMTGVAGDPKARSLQASPTLNHSAFQEVARLVGNSQYAGPFFGRIGGVKDSIFWGVTAANATDPSCTGVYEFKGSMSNSFFTPLPYQKINNLLAPPAFATGVKKIWMCYGGQLYEGVL